MTSEPDITPELNDAGQAKSALTKLEIACSAPDSRNVVLLTDRARAPNGR
jgi:hypothetical protein